MARGAGAVFDHERLAPLRAHALEDEARHDVAAAARRIADHDADRLSRITGGRIEHQNQRQEQIEVAVVRDFHVPRDGARGTVAARMQELE